MTRQRRKVVVMAAGVASMSGMGPLLMLNHLWLRLGWLLLMAALLVLTLVELVKLKRQERR